MFTLCVIHAVCKSIVISSLTHQWSFSHDVQLCEETCILQLHNQLQHRIKIFLFLNSLSLHATMYFSFEIVTLSAERTVCFGFVSHLQKTCLAFVTCKWWTRKFGIHEIVSYRFTGLMNKNLKRSNFYLP